VHICTVSLYPYEDSSVNSTSLSVRCDDRSVKKDERVISELTIVLAYGDKLESSIASKLNWIDVSTFKRTAELHWMIISNQLYVRHHWPSSFQSCSSYKLWYVNHSHCEDEKKTQLISEGFKEIQILYSDWSEMIALIVMNEGHHLRNLKIRAHVSVWDLNCDHHWFLTVTSSINTLLIS
jgi:hypothetical protein